MTFATSPITSSRPSPVDASPTKPLYWPCHGRGASLVLPIDRGPRRLSAWRIRFTEAADLIRRRRRRSDPFAAAAETKPNKSVGRNMGHTAHVSQKIQGDPCLGVFRGGESEIRTGGNSCAVATRWRFLSNKKPLQRAAF